MVNGRRGSLWLMGEGLAMVNGRRGALWLMGEGLVMVNGGGARYG